LKKSKLKHVYYLCEGKLSQNSAVPESSVEAALQTTRFVDGFKVQRTRDIEDSVEWLTRLGLVIEKMLISDLNETTYLEFQYSFEEFNQESFRFRHNTNSIFGQMLRQIPKCGKESVHSILNYYKTVKELYDDLNQAESKSRVDFLKGISSKLSKVASQNIIQIFCDGLENSTKIDDSESKGNQHF
jgi:ERCC4-type nuclease